MELAEHAGVSQPSVTRFVTLLGFDGYAEFRRFLRDLSTRTARPDDDNQLQYGLAHDVASIESLRTGLDHPDRLRENAARLVASVPLVVLGFRVSAPVASLFAYLSAKIHPDVRLLTTGGSVVGDELRHAHHQGASAAVVFALPRYPRETARALTFAGELGMRTLLITDKPVSPLTPEADDALVAPVGTDLVFDSHAAVVSLSTALLEAMTDAAGVDAQQRLESFERYAQQQELFVED